MEQGEFRKLGEGETSNYNGNSAQNANRIMGMAAIFISVLSMLAVMYQSYLSREENKLTRIQQSATVLPYLDYWYSNVGSEYKFVIENKGVGPAFIKNVRFIGIDFESKDSLFFSSSHQLYGHVKQQSNFLDSIPVVMGSFSANRLISPNEKKIIFNFSFENQEQKERFSTELYKFFAGLEIVYEDVYGSKWVLNSDKGYPVEFD